MLLLHENFIKKEKRTKNIDDYTKLMTKLHWCHYLKILLKKKKEKGKKKKKNGGLHQNYDKITSHT